MRQRFFIHDFIRQLEQRRRFFEPPFLPVHSVFPSTQDTLSRMLGMQTPLSTFHKKSISGLLSTHPPYWIPPKHKPLQIDFTTLNGFLRTENYLTARIQWLSTFTPYASHFIDHTILQLEIARERQRQQEKERDRELNKVTKFVVDIFKERGWHILPVLYFSDFLLPIILLDDLKEGWEVAEQTAIKYMKAAQNDLLDYVKDKLTGIGLEDNIAAQRLGSIQRQFNLACEGENVDNVASFMVAEAEGIYTDFTARLGLGTGYFYTRETQKQEERKQVLKKWHEKLIDSEDFYGEEFTRRHYKIFSKTREKVIPKRNEIQHGSLNYRTQADAFWATTFLILTLEYVNGISRIVESEEDTSLHQ
ncbi:hypothetical protein GO986_22210 [Deinococcus sp. HMF7620]|uniref:Uncharacterized protein n=1 Tax=Deinococcus arboris TaxID=2682977 RepID=A0A7C9HUK1_9DEIO|nr:hypothetical protein [Deinococcus arboris]MVN89452.1 hypothetical protein [Deinococcus arboris]